MDKPQLFLLHFAGGSQFSYRNMFDLLGEFEVIGVELPGRSRRVTEDLLKDFELAATDIFKQIIGRLNSSKYLIYGHSMGALLGLRVAKMLELENRSPSYLIVTGNPGPGIREYKNRHLLAKDEFIAELKKLGGMPPEVFEDADLFNFFENILRADFELVERNDFTNEPIVDVPIYAVMGNQEENSDDIKNWDNFTNSRFECQIMEGDHFFIFDKGSAILQIIRNCYDSINL